mmetsp:Transcript_25878/g.86105  ORF Transcript_25878/g.86105 Transcript_25878/m.86105 type:complete len:205 (+) Transcript_25878:618-1232(+)
MATSELELTTIGQAQCNKLIAPILVREIRPPSPRDVQSIIVARASKCNCKIVPIDGLLDIIRLPRLTKPDWDTSCLVPTLARPSRHACPRQASGVRLQQSLIHAIIRPQQHHTRIHGCHRPSESSSKYNRLRRGNADQKISDIAYKHGVCIKVQDQLVLVQPPQLKLCPQAWPQVQRGRRQIPDEDEATALQRCQHFPNATRQR